jgi:hypothetical protein
MDVGDAEAAPSSSLLVPGRRVRLCGLESRPELNGHEVAVRTWLTASSRFSVELVAELSVELEAGCRRFYGRKYPLAVRPTNLACDCPDFRLRLLEDDELLAGALLPLLDIDSLCKLRATDSKLAPLVRFELSRRPLRWRFEHDWRAAFEGGASDSHCEALFERAWLGGGFAADTPRDWFCGSEEARTERPEELRFRVGDLFQHQSSGYLGYVVRWDARTRAPREWVEAHRRVNAPGTRCERLFAPHLSVREFVPDAEMPQGVGFQTRYVIEDHLRPFHPDGVGMAEAQALQDEFFAQRNTPRLPPKFYWHVLGALHNDAMMLKICIEHEAHAGLKVLGPSHGDPALSTAFERLDGAIVPRTPGIAPRGETDLVFRGCGRLVPNTVTRARYPKDVRAA